MLTKIRLNDWNDSYWAVKSLYSSLVFVQAAKNFEDLFEFHTFMEDAVYDDLLNF